MPEKAEIIDLNKELLEKKQILIEEKIRELVEKNLSFSTCFTSYEELKKQALYLQPGLPQNKPLRMLSLEGVGSVADGGTQVQKTGEIGSITIPLIQKKEGNVLIYYKLEI